MHVVFEAGCQKNANSLEVNVFFFVILETFLFLLLGVGLGVQAGARTPFVRGLYVCCMVLCMLLLLSPVVAVFTVLCNC